MLFPLALWSWKISDIMIQLRLWGAFKRESWTCVTFKKHFKSICILFKCIFIYFYIIELFFECRLPVNFSWCCCGGGFQSKYGTIDMCLALYPACWLFFISLHALCYFLSSIPCGAERLSIKHLMRSLLSHCTVSMACAALSPFTDQWPSSTNPMTR